MDIQEYISSGVLEAYVLGDLSEQEVNEVERMAKQHPEIKDEIETIEEFLSDIAQKTAIQPPEGLKEQILDRLDQGEKLSSESGHPKRTGKIFPKKDRPPLECHLCPEKPSQTKLQRLPTIKRRWILKFSILQNKSKLPPNQVERVVAI